MTLKFEMNGKTLRDRTLLALLPGEDYERLLPHLKPVKLSRGRVVYNPGDQIDDLYFPISSVVSLFYADENGLTAEIAMVGNLGAVGYPAFLGVESALHQAVVQIAGDAYRIRAKVVQEEFRRGGSLQRLLLCYTQSLIAQISQISICSRLHSFEQKLSRWLLFCHDRVKHDEIPLTQETISQLLGARREAVTVAAGHLQNARLIKYVRGHIHILDRRGLEQIACECYQVVDNENQRLVALFNSSVERK